MDIKPLTPHQLKLIQAHNAWFVERYNKSEPTINIDHIENNNRLLKFRVDCSHDNPVKN